MLERMSTSVLPVIATWVTGASKAAIALPQGALTLTPDVSRTAKSVRSIGIPIDRSSSGL